MDEEENKLVLHTFPLVRFSDMPEDMKTDVVEYVSTAVEKHMGNNEAAAKMIKLEMDRKYGPPFHVVVGEGYGFEISYELKSCLYLFFAGTHAIMLWKC